MSAAPVSEFSLSIRSRLEQLAQYISTENNQPSISLEVLIDAFLAIHTDCKAATNNNEQIAGFLTQCATAVLDDQLVTKLQQLRVNTRDFETIKTLATGAVGRVCLVRAKKDARVYAMKILKKSDLLTRREAAFFMEERNALVFSQKSAWITTLYAAFQDEENLYLVMEYVSGGSLRSLLNNRETAMDEAEARFYVAEMVLALCVLHEYNYIHRDVKPENCLIDSNGHIKLADFGSCIRLGETARVTSHETVGTPDYISPEILRALEGAANYGQSVDWWSLGVILYELLFDEVPFYSESLVETYGKIMDHEKYFAFPDDTEISDSCKDLIQKLICKQEDRLGKNGVQEIKDHPWFAGIEWNTIRESKPPFVPELSGPEDTRYFEDEENESKKFAKKTLNKTREYSGRNLPFVGYTYVKNATALISWPELSPEKSGFSTSSLGRSKGGRAASVADADLSAISTIKEQLQQETQKVSTLSASKKQADDEISSLKSALGRETAQRAEIQSMLAAIEKEKIKLETDYKQLKLASDRDSHDRVELEQKLEQLKATLNAEMQGKAENNELSEIRKRLERDVATLTAALQEERSQGIKREIGITELVKAKKMLDKETEKLNKALQDEKKAKQDVSAKVAGLTKRIESEITRSTEIESKLVELQNTSLNQLSEIDALKQNYASETERSQRLTQRAAEIEKEKAVYQIEIENLRNKIAEVISHADQLSRNISDLQSSQRETADEEIESLRAQLTLQTQARSRMTDEIAQLSKAKTMMELEKNEINARYDEEINAHAETRNALKIMQLRLNEQTQRIAALDEIKKKLEAMLEDSETRIMEMSSQLEEQAQQLAALFESSESTQSTNLELISELREMTVKHEHEAQSAASLKVKIEELEQDRANELKTRISLESQCKNQQQITAQLTQESDRLRARIDFITKEHENSITEHHNAITQLTASHQVLEEKLKVEREQRFQLEDAKATMARWVQELEEDARREAEVRARTERLLDTANKKIIEISVENDQHIQITQAMQDRVEELERLVDTLKYKLEATEERERETLLQLQQQSEKKDAHSRFKLRGLFFKGSRDTIAESAAPASSEHRAAPLLALQRLQESDDDRKDADHRRKQSSQSMDSLASSVKLTITSPIQPPSQMTAKPGDIAVSLDFFNPDEPLQGWLKIPKGGKVKKGWKLQYAVVREFKVFLYERDKDVDVTLGVPLVDITSDIFLAKAVSQNEVIHANGKDIDLIFKVQAWSAGTTEETANNTSDVLQRIQKLQVDIDHEEKMQQAAEKILGVTTDTQKITVISQIDASNKRLRVLKHELEKLTALAGKKMYAAETSLASSKDSIDDSTSVRGAESTVKASDDAQSLRKELEEQLEDETKKREALSKLASNDGKKKSKEGHANAKDVEIELLTTDRVIAKIK
eukprot:jgi/Hompol1/6686/HPOL_005052-RA